MAVVAALGIDTSDFTPEQMDAFEKILDDAAEAIEAATDSEGVKKALEDAIKALDEVADDEPLFSDVNDPEKFYYDAVYWAFNANPQITKGTDDTHFGPDNACTRGQVVTFLWRAAGCPAPKSTQTPFEDLTKDAYYETAVAWALENEITKGIDDTHFGPEATCTRSQIVSFLWRFKNQPEPKSTKTPFSDLKSGAFYENAVAWAVEEGITKGTTETTFGPEDTCSRGQVVTFLYRATQK